MTNPISFDVLEKAYDEELREKGAWLHFLGPDGNPMHIKVDGKDVPVRARVRSVLSLEYDRHMDNLQTGAASKARKIRGEEARRQALLREMKENEPKAFAALVSAMDNVSAAQPGVIEVSARDLLHFATQPRNRSWVQQVMEFAQDTSNYMAPGTEDDKGGKPPAPAAD